METLLMHTVPCTQESNIDQISKTLDRMEKSQERVIELLEKVANQDARIDNLEEHKDICLHNADVLFNRVRDLELANAEISIDSLKDFKDSLNKLTNFFQLTTSKYAVWMYTSILAMVLFGFIMDVLYHFDKVVRALELIKGVV